MNKTDSYLEINRHRYPRVGLHSRITYFASCRSVNRELGRRLKRRSCSAASRRRASAVTFVRRLRVEIVASLVVIISRILLVVFIVVLISRTVISHCRISR